MAQSNGVQKPLPESGTRRLTGIALFAALAVALSLSPLKVLAPYPPFALYYELWEIPIVAITLIYGVYAGFSVDLLNTVVLLLVFPGASPTGPIYNLIAVVATLGAFSLSYKTFNLARFRSRVAIATVTTLAILVRVGVMTVVNFAFLQQSAPLGFSLPEKVVVPLLPFIAFFNATVVLYSVPLGYAVVKAISPRFRAKMAYGVS